MWPVTSPTVTQDMCYCCWLLFIRLSVRSQNVDGETRTWHEQTRTIHFNKRTCWMLMWPVSLYNLTVKRCLVWHKADMFQFPSLMLLRFTFLRLELKRLMHVALKSCYNSGQCCTLRHKLLHFVNVTYCPLSCYILRRKRSLLSFTIVFEYFNN